MRPSPSTAKKKENAPAEAEASKEFASPRAKQSARDLSASLRELVQARRTVQIAMELDDVISENLPLPIGREAALGLYRECWAILEAAPSILCEDFEQFFGAKLKRFCFAVHAIGWLLLCDDQKARRAAGDPKTAPFIRPEELGQ
ncbi:MAG TPA: hypothetical protein DEA40_05695 [Parvularcula sp.]|nr:hypothetical protein [Parvularcula sp.]